MEVLGGNPKPLLPGFLPRLKIPISSRADKRNMFYSPAQLCQVRAEDFMLAQKARKPCKDYIETLQKQLVLTQQQQVADCVFLPLGLSLWTPSIKEEEAGVGLLWLLPVPLFLRDTQF